MLFYAVLYRFMLLFGAKHDGFNVFFFQLDAQAADRVQIFDGDAASTLQIGSDLTGSTPPAQQASGSAVMTLSSTTGATFTAEFECGPDPNPCDTGGNANLVVGGDPSVETVLLCGAE